MMTDFSIKTGKRLGIYASALGAICLAVGLVEIFGGLGEMIPGDLFGGFALVVIAATYLSGVKGTFHGRHEGLSFLMGGLFLTAVFGVLYLLMMGADGLMYLLGEAEALPKLVEARPAVWIFILSLPLAYRVRRLTDRMTW
jgi:hypothetical protein